jgi:hypothetical protein
MLEMLSSCPRLTDHWPDRGGDDRRAPRVGSLDRRGGEPVGGLGGEPVGSLGAIGGGADDRGRSRSGPGGRAEHLLQLIHSLS